MINNLLSNQLLSFFIHNLSSCIIFIVADPARDAGGNTGNLKSNQTSGKSEGNKRKLKRSFRFGNVSFTGMGKPQLLR
jgi:hypothetical protein